MASVTPTSLAASGQCDEWSRREPSDMDKARRMSERARDTFGHRRARDYRESLHLVAAVNIGNTTVNSRD